MSASVGFGYFCTHLRVYFWFSSCRFLLPCGHDAGGDPGPAWLNLLVLLFCLSGQAWLISGFKLKVFCHSPCWSTCHASAFTETTLPGLHSPAVHCCLSNATLLHQCSATVTVFSPWNFSCLQPPIWGTSHHTPLPLHLKGSQIKVQRSIVSQHRVTRVSPH